MKALLLAFGLLTTSATAAFADQPQPTVPGAVKDARLVPVMREDAFVGLKVYAIRAGGRFDQPQDRFHNGDTIETIDGVAVTTDAGATALYEKVVLGKADASVTVRRKGELVTLQSKAIR